MVPKLCLGTPAGEALLRVAASGRRVLGTGSRASRADTPKRSLGAMAGQGAGRTLLVPKLCLGTPVGEALLRVVASGRRAVGTGSRASRTDTPKQSLGAMVGSGAHGAQRARTPFPRGAWEREEGWFSAIAGKGLPAYAGAMRSRCLVLLVVSHGGCAQRHDRPRLRCRFQYLPQCPYQACSCAESRRAGCSRSRSGTGRRRPLCRPL